MYHCHGDLLIHVDAHTTEFLRTYPSHCVASAPSLPKIKYCNTIGPHCTVRWDMACVHSSPDPSLSCGSGSGLWDYVPNLQDWLCSSLQCKLCLSLQNEDKNMQLVIMTKKLKCDKAMHFDEFTSQTDWGEGGGPPDHSLYNCCHVWSVMCGAHLSTKPFSGSK